MDENFLSDINDNLYLAVKSRLLEETKAWYTALGWTITKEYPDTLYIDVTHLDLTRPHKIANKDRLQLLQVRVEMLVNLSARADRRSNVYAGLWSAFLFLLGAAIAACGIALCVLSSGTFYLVCGIVIALAGVLFWLISAFSWNSMHDYYRDRFKPYKEILKANIREIIEEASVLTGLTDGDKEQHKD